MLHCAGAPARNANGNLAICRQRRAAPAQRLSKLHALYASCAAEVRWVLAAKLAHLL